MNRTILEADDDDIPSNTSTELSISELINRRLSRRSLLGAGLKLGLGSMGALAAGPAIGGLGRAEAASSAFGFEELPHGYDETHHVAPGYESQVLFRWGDPVMDDAPPFDPRAQTAAAQLRQFGYNNDFIGYLPLPYGGHGRSRGLLCVNHEYTNNHLMFPGLEGGDLAQMTAEQVDVEMAAHGHSIIELARTDGRWHRVAGSPYNRRLSTLASRLRLSGPAAGHPRLRTRGDPTGRIVIGTLNNCAGGVTPWGTVLIAEENFHGYFGGDPSATPEARNYKRYGLKPQSRYAWSRFHPRFDVEQEPNEPNRFGWVVEVDPYDPTSTPVKRTALGRFKHEGATCVVNPDGRLSVYSGDDQRFDYLYRFVTHGRVDPNDRSRNRDLLDSGVLYVARFRDDGTLRWLPLVHGTGPLTPDNGFHSQADVLIETRRAADLLGATPMDRPEDVKLSPITGALYVNLTNNTRRDLERVDAANPRPQNRHGHVLELLPPGSGEPGADHAALEYRWEILILAGDPRDPQDQASYHPDVSSNGWFSAPDNAVVDEHGRLWIATDGAPKAGFADGLWVCEVEGERRALTRHFFRAPRGAEVCSPCFAPDSETLFVAIQHPGDERGSSYDQPSTRWPDFDDRLPPRPAVLALTRKGGGTIGS